MSEGALDLFMPIRKPLAPALTHLPPSSPLNHLAHPYYEKHHPIHLNSPCDLAAITHEVMSSWGVKYVLTTFTIMACVRSIARWGHLNLWPLRSPVPGIVISIGRGDTTDYWLVTPPPERAVVSEESIRDVIRSAAANCNSLAAGSLHC